MELTQVMLFPLIIATFGILYSLPQMFKELKKLKIKKYYLALLLLLSISFFLFEVFIMKPTERLFFDENLYQDEAIDILKQFNAKMCMYGTNETCKIFTYYHQGIAWAYIIALGYLISGINAMHTAWNLNLIFSTLSIPLLFFVCYMLTKKESTSLLATFFYASMPLVLIWTRTGCAEISLVFFSLLSILSLLLWIKTKNKKIAVLVVSSIIFAAQGKIEGVFILPILVTFYLLFFGFKSEGLEKIFLPALILLIPAFIYLFIQYERDPFGAAGNKKFALEYFVKNIKTNSLYWFNFYQNGTPIQTQNVSNLLIPIFALLSIFFKKKKETFSVFIWFIIPFLIYASFYAGSVTYGVDNRFMLSCVPPIVILASFGVSALYTFLSKKSKVLSICVVVILLSGYIYLFKELLPYITVDPMKIWEAYDARIYVFDFVLKYYSEIPKDCYFVSFVPGLFRTLGRNAVYIEDFFYLYTSGELKGKCLVFDYGYWCIVPPFHDTSCQAVLQRFKLQPITNLTLEDGRTLAFYYILNSTK
jgi:4-amino-4-deoxy-L-arabinose transferase-like glycosyltransferase